MDEALYESQPPARDEYLEAPESGLRRILGMVIASTLKLVELEADHTAFNRGASTGEVERFLNQQMPEFTHEILQYANEIGVSVTLDIPTEHGSVQSQLTRFVGISSNGHLVGLFASGANANYRVALDQQILEDMDFTR